jgi:hypothetical protein
MLSTTKSIYLNGSGRVQIENNVTASRLLKGMIVCQVRIISLLRSSICERIVHQFRIMSPLLGFIKIRMVDNDLNASIADKLKPEGLTKISSLE